MRRTASGSLTLCMTLVLVPATAAEAPSATHPAGCADFAGTVSRALMIRPVGMNPGAGILHQPVGTKVQGAQAYYDQGVAYLSSYVWVEAARSFTEALRLDESLAMAHVGLARAYAGADADKEASEHLEKARTLAEAGTISDKEKTWVALATQQWEAVKAGPDKAEELHAAYKLAIDKLIETDPSDPFAWILRGNAEEPGAWGRGQAGGIGSIAYYETALARDPSNLAAHHFLVHSYEQVGRHAEAAEHARSYLAQAPSIPHAHHMLGHVLPRLGLWEEALERFGEADLLERDYYGAEAIPAEEDWHHGHNLHLLGYVNLRLGRVEEAGRMFEEAFNLEPRGEEDPRDYGAPWVEYLILNARFEEAVTAAQTLQARGAGYGLLQGAGLEGEALLALGRLKDADRALGRAKRHARAVMKGEGGGGWLSFTKRQVAPQIRTLESLLELSGRNAARGRKALIEMADKVAENPLFDAWGAGLFRLKRIAMQAGRAGQPDLVADLRERMKKIDPGYPMDAEDDDRSGKHPVKESAGGP